jgi:hypothetical protein
MASTLKIELDDRTHERGEDQARWAAYEADGEAFDSDAVLDALERSLTGMSRPCPG